MGKNFLLVDVFLYSSNLIPIISSLRFVIGWEGHWLHDTILRYDPPHSKADKVNQHRQGQSHERRLCQSNPIHTDESDQKTGRYHALASKQNSPGRPAAKPLDGIPPPLSCKQHQHQERQPLELSPVHERRRPRIQEAIRDVSQERCSAPHDGKVRR